MENYKGKEYKAILAWVEDGIGHIKLNRPKSLNSIDFTLLNDSYDVLSLYAEDPEVRCIIISGEENVFAAGADLKALAGYDSFQAYEFLDAVHRTIFAMEDNPKPIIAAVNGLALGGGLELMLACDIRIVADNCTFGFPEISLGIFPGGGGTQRTPRNASICMAKQYIFTGDFFDTETAYRMGLVNMVVPPAEVMDAAKKMARKISRKGALALREAKKCINNSMNLDIKSGSRAEQVSWSMLFASEDKSEGINAFLESRKAEFKGR
jgi:enoyl-CoA hydratase/carnithine racemase